MKPLRSKAGGHQQIAKYKKLPAPTSGWYVGDNQAAPPPKTAVVLVNAFPQLDYVRLRLGSLEWAKGMGASPVQSLLTWTNGLVSRMFAVTSGQIFDASGTGVVPAALVSNLKNSYLEAVQFTGLNGTYLVAVNGADPVQIFDGTGWNRTITFTGLTSAGTPTVTGVSSVAGLQRFMAVSATDVPAGTTISTIGVGTLTLSANATSSGIKVFTAYQNAPITGYTGEGFSFVWIFKGHLFFVDGGTLNAVYLPLASIGGAVTQFPLASIFKLGGRLLCGATWAIDSTSGIYESCVFISTEGEVLVYTGDSPSATNWTLTGTYKISRPLGPRCLMRAGGDLLIMTEDGIVPMSKVETLDQIALQNEAVTKPIAPAWRKAVIARQGRDGWQIVSWPLETFAIINLPKLTASDREQYVVNSRSGAWAQYIGWDANCFAVFNNQLFYGTSDGRVVRGEIGGQDDGALAYTTTVMLAFTNLGLAQNKNVTMVRPYVQSTTIISAKSTIKTDYDITVPVGPTAVSKPVGALWGTAIWGKGVWGGGLVNQNNWMDASGYGTAIAVCWQVKTNAGTVSPDVRLAAFDVLYEPGNILGG